MKLEQLIEKYLGEGLNPLKTDWKGIKNVRDLKNILNKTIEYLESKGKNDIAKKWKKNLSNMPSKMDKEAINVILVSASKELGLIK